MTSAAAHPYHPMHPSSTMDNTTATSRVVTAPSLLRLRFSYCDRLPHQSFPLPVLARGEAFTVCLCRFETQLLLGNTTTPPFFMHLAQLAFSVHAYNGRVLRWGDQSLRLFPSHDHPPAGGRSVLFGAVVARISPTLLQRLSQTPSGQPLVLCMGVGGSL